MIPLKKKGLTLVELLITMSIGVVVGTMLLVILVNSGGLFYKESSKIEQGLNINDAFSVFDEAVKQAVAIETSHAFGSTTYTSGIDQLVLKMSAIDSSNNIISNAYDYYIFFLDQTKLRLRTFPDPQSSRKSRNQIFSTAVDSLTFKYFDNSNPPNEVLPASAKKVRMEIILKQKSGAGFETNIATAEANLRND